MAVYLSPAGASSAPVANQLRVLVVLKEGLCNEDAYCVTSTAQPQTNVTYRVGTTRLVGTTLFIPITATTSVVIPKGCHNAVTRVFTDTFVVAFQEYSGPPTVGPTITNLGRDVQPSCVKCGCAHGVTVNDSLFITLTAPAAAPATTEAEATE
uniref:Uncharacterized protein n=1 Tax=Dulem virus 40 TaxID=3145758 RepID=A0AAU8AXV6_9CAUD